MYKPLLCLCRGSICGTVDSFQSGEAFAGRRSLTVVTSLAVSGCGRGHEHTSGLICNRMFIDVLYTHFDMCESYFRMVDVRDTRFDIQKGCVRTVYALYICFDIQKLMEKPMAQVSSATSQ